jgi:hypothetical protein
MKKLGLLVALACLGVFGANTTHDAPLEVERNTVHVYFRADTLIDPAKSLSRWGNPSQLLQHTHAIDHTVRIFVGGRAPTDVTIKPNDELHFRLAGKRRFFGLFPGQFRGYLTVKPKTIPGAGALVAGHAAKVNETNPECGKRSGADLAHCVTTNLSQGDRNSLDLVWVAQAPSGLSWQPKGALSTPQDITNAINAAAQAPNHAAARNASRIEYELKGGAEVFVDRFFVVAENKSPKGHGIELHRGSRVVVCENWDEKEDGNPKPFCPTR